MYGETQQNNDGWLVAIFLAIVLVGGSVAAYMYGNFGGIDKDTLTRDYVKRDSVVFEDLSYDTQSEYIRKSEHKRLLDIAKNNAFNEGEIEELDQITKLQNRIQVLEKERQQATVATQSVAKLEAKITALTQQNRQLSASLQAKQGETTSSQELTQLKNQIAQLKMENSTLIESVNSAPTLLEQTQEIAQLQKSVRQLSSQNRGLKQQLAEKQTEVAPTLTDNTPAISVASHKKSGSYDSIGCYDLEGGKYHMSHACSNKIEKFLQGAPKNAYYEVITVFGSDDSVLKNYDFSGSKLNDLELSQLDHMAKQGLGQLRSKEAVWKIQQKLGKDANVHVANYTIEQKQQRGVVIRRYH
jgi:predicted RNase H-like nuclease (RuvC/YqgF family)